ncbi:MAG TPA: hypothetical protein VHA80_05575 [Solirubrobacterales bacterium]|nr:hypothetical protein [Solirubrobacterales bacterium]
MSSYKIAVAPVGAEGQAEVLREVRHGTVALLASALGDTLEEVVAGGGPMAIQVRIESITPQTTYKELYGHLAELDGELVRLRLRDGTLGPGRIEVPIAALAREMLLDGEEVPWGEVTLVETMDGARFRGYCEGPAAPACAIDGLVVLAVGGPPPDGP